MKVPVKPPPLKSLPVRLSFAYFEFCRSKNDGIVARKLPEFDRGLKRFGVFLVCAIFSHWLVTVLRREFQFHRWPWIDYLFR